MSIDQQLLGTSIIGSRRALPSGQTFHAINPATGDEFEPVFYSASAEDVAAAAQLSAEAFLEFGRLAGARRAELLRSIADVMEEIRETLIERTMAESGLPKGRVVSELGRTTSQLRLFADLVEEGSWVDARIDLADPERTPIPRPDIRSIMRPLGPVAVFCASNFPLAFSVAGGDTAAALAAGCPVVVNAHSSHPGAAELAGLAIQTAVRRCELPEGVFSLILSTGYETGLSLVEHPSISAVSFTGSRQGGEAIMEAAANRPIPIPAFTEMSSTNPVFILPEIMREKGKELAEGLFGSYTLGSGQFCTNPGLVFVEAGEAAERFISELANRVRSAGAYTMLNAGIQTSYTRLLDERSNYPSLELIATSVPDDGPGFTTEASLFRTKAPLFVSHPEMQEEMFGPSTIIITYTSEQELFDAIAALHGHLTATLHGVSSELFKMHMLIDLLERKVGRVVVNGFPTGVEVCPAMVHGGPYPATSNSHFTSVGTRSIYRFVRPVCYQGMPDGLLPPELQNGNPLAILRMLGGEISRNSL